MESNLNYQVLTEYSKKFSESLSDKFFSQNKTISGNDILSISPVKQINFFVLHNLFANWKEEMQGLKSPFFDYSSKEVRKSLKEFMNVVSRHISIEENDFKPLLEKAVFDTLWLLLSPYDYYSNIISPPSASRLKVKILDDYLKYVKINKELFESYLHKLKKSGDEVFIDEANRILNEVFANTEYSPEDIANYEQELSKVIPLKIEEFYSVSPAQSNVNETVAELNDETVEDDQVTLNDTLKGKDDTPTLADVHSQKRIISLKDSLSINQKFMFINQLFDGNVDDFNKIVDFIDQSNTYDEASGFLHSNYIKKNSWKKDSQEVKEFLEIIEKRFLE